MELLERYIKEIAEDLRVDELNIKDVQMRLPSRKHFWSARLINHKIDLQRIKKSRDKKKKELIQQVADNAPIKFSMPSLEKTVDSLDTMEELNDSVREQELIIELLEKVEKNFNSMTYDIKNIIEIIKLEQL
jgi:hypothetical protein